MNLSPFAGLLLLCSVSVPAAAQDSTHRTAKVASGQQIRLGAHFNLRRDCSPAPPPELRVISPPRHGSLSIRSGKARSERVRNCQNVEAPVRLVFYQSNRDYTGEDQLTYEVKKADGTTEAHTVTITISPSSAAPPGPTDKPGSVDL